MSGVRVGVVPLLCAVLGVAACAGPQQAATEQSTSEGSASVGTTEESGSQGTSTGATGSSPGSQDSVQRIPVQASKSQPDEAVLGSLRAADAVAGDPGGSSDELAQWTSGQLLDELKAQQGELADAELMAQGESQILWVTVKDSNRAATVTACVDNSAITFVDANGVTQPRADSPEPVINIYKLRKANDGWTVVSRTFPDNPFCTSEGR